MGFLAVHEKQTQLLEREPSRLSSKDRSGQQKLKGRANLKGEQTPWVPRDWDTSSYLKKVNLRGHCFSDSLGKSREIIRELQFGQSRSITTVF
ncbi:hypothetical protein AVEN_142287-1 [Araneus ventricosus]|uniref:Uncharacterized protein n=1 Tax=Araneus ventricosus TaxID=182803 RepID=A0A4Y2N133_ARAVE|nr:hypothetical protein AVEN_142287-1 [Araneus ventricosus]